MVAIRLAPVRCCYPIPPAVRVPRIQLEYGNDDFDIRQGRGSKYEQT